MHTPWMLLQSHGVVTGAQSKNAKHDPFAESGLCKRYPLPHCTHGGSGNGNATNPCPYPKEHTSQCPDNKESPHISTKCDDSATGSHADYAKDKVTFDGDVVVYDIDEQSVQMAILKGGPVAASMAVYADFPTYRSGIYQNLGGEALGYHAIKIVGWGVENGIKYWKIVNSWNRFWGADGFFKMIRGKNECGILNTVVSSSEHSTWWKMN